MDQDARDGSDAVRNAAAVAPPRAFGIDEHVNRTVVGILEQRRPPVGAARRLIESVEPPSDLLHDGKASLEVLVSKDQWYGVTYPEDKQSVIDALAALRENGTYKF